MQSGPQHRPVASRTLPAASPSATAAALRCRIGSTAALPATCRRGILTRLRWSHNEGVTKTCPIPVWQKHRGPKDPLKGAAFPGLAAGLREAQPGPAQRRALGEAAALAAWAGGPCASLGPRSLCACGTGPLCALVPGRLVAAPLGMVLMLPPSLPTLCMSPRGDGVCCGVWGGRAGNGN